MKIGPYENQDVARQILFLEGRIHLFESKWTLESEIWNLVSISLRIYLIGTILQKVPFIHHFTKKIDRIGPLPPSFW